MTTEERDSTGYFPIPRESADIPFERFYEQYYETEQPVILEGVSSEWPARHKWTSDYLQRALSQEPSAVASTLWYWVDRGGMEYDYAVPDLIRRIYDLNECFPRTKNIRIWVHPEGNVTPWHYDVSMVNIFYAQVTGEKEWFLVSPKTPPRCYPFSYYAIIDGRNDRVLDGKIYTRFTLSEGDMVYVPPCWFHKVLSHGRENISLNWAMTNRKTSVRSATLARELEIYAIQDYFAEHRFAVVRKLFDKLYFAIPDYLRYRWQYEDPIDAPYKPGGLDLWKRALTELAAFGPTVVHAKRAYATIRGINVVRRLGVDRAGG